MFRELSAEGDMLRRSAMAARGGVSFFQSEECKDWLEKCVVCFKEEKIDDMFIDAVIALMDESQANFRRFDELLSTVRWLANLESNGGGCSCRGNQYVWC
ncbi:hypothetical protein [Heliophilum fasciatum]|uniref:Uncharacterized protein n=1 Tax=Heliophilum fasciatum TaxID=35700 RepID=A0A4V2SX30_9FIRM|nr:hypothetical protein [Heliophilum fasciatum]MCW2277984.1 hypothetical protein [Heliophilum fasciatum]TCP64396.1 hypothetical protein EDD73_11095 [Heliophilum fasciatum]